MPSKSKLFTALLCALPSVAHAATNESLAETTLPEVLITASRFEESSNHVPANVKIITREDIENSSSNNIPEALSQLGGLIINGTGLGQLGLGALVDMGGYGATANSTTLILLDGQRLNPIDSSSVSWESIPLGSVRRIEILRGGASVQYGNGAVGGVINIITKDGGANIQDVTVKAGSFGTIMTNAALSLGAGNTSLRLNANSANSNGWRENSAANLYAFGGKLTKFMNGQDEIYLEVNASHSNAQAPGGVVGEVGQGNPQLAKFNNIGTANAVENASVLFGGVQRLSNKLTFEGEVMYSSRTSNFYTPYYFPTYAYNNKLQAWSWNLTPRIKADLGELGTTIVGCDLNKSSTVSGDSFSTQSLLYNGALRMNDSGNATLVNYSPYIIERFPLSTSAELSGGLRRQSQSASAYNASIFSATTADTNKTYTANAADLALNFNYLGGQKTFIKWNQSFRFPNTDEFWGWDFINNSPVFNGILQPQISQTIEIGGDWFFGQTHLTASIFQSNTKNEIRLDPVTWANLNSPDDIHRKGLLFDSTTYATSKLVVSIGGKLQRSIYSSGIYSGNTISSVPDLTAHVRANYPLSEHWSVGGIVSYIGSQSYDGDSSNTLHKISSSAVADVYSSYKSNSWETRLTIKNFAGTNYATSGGTGGVSMPYYYYPSDPRAYYLTLKHAF